MSIIHHTGTILRDLLNGFFNDNAIGGYVNLLSHKVYKRSPRQLCDFIERHDAVFLNRMAFAYRLLMIQNLLESYDDVGASTKGRISQSIVKLLFTAPYPKDYEEFENEWVRLTAKKLADIDPHRVIGSPEYLPLLKRTMASTMQAYEDITGIKFEPIDVIDIDFGANAAAAYVQNGRRMIVNPQRLGHTALDVMGAGLHEQLHDVSLMASSSHARMLRDGTFSEDVLSGGGGLDKTPFSNMATILAYEHIAYDSIYRVSGDLGKYSTLMERIACSFQRKVEFQLVGIKPRTALFYDTFRAESYAPQQSHVLAAWRHSLERDKPRISLKLRAAHAHGKATLARKKHQKPAATGPG